MVKVEKVLRPVKYAPNDEYVIVTVLTDTGDTAEIFVGGEVKVFFDHRYNKIKAFVKYPQDIDISNIIR